MRRFEGRGHRSLEVSYDDRTVTLKNMDDDDWTDVLAVDLDLDTVENLIVHLLRIVAR